jgi:mono/diheme cytochrome c family protein
VKQLKQRATAESAEGRRDRRGIRLPILLCASLRFCSLFLILVSARTAHAATDPAATEFFEKKIRPVLVERCYKCHSAESEKLKGNLHLDTPEGIKKGGESGKSIIVAGEPDRSLLIEAIRYKNEDLQMPPKQRLSDAQIADFVAWVQMGAPDPRTAAAALTPVSKSDFWSFKPPQDHPLPNVKNKSWPISPIDHFILSTLEQKNLQPSAPGDKRTLIRRATYDLAGLPPTPSEVEAFINDKSPTAYANLIDRLLASPRYGERYGRHWLDLARYSDTKGYVYDREERHYVHSHAYRDWVIRAFNDDLPYDQFLMNQIAADQLITTRAPEGNRNLAAMGLLTVGRRFLGIPHDIIDDRIDTVTRTTLGLSVGCARCHDHKFDPIPTADYYSLYGVFAGSAEKLVRLDPEPPPSEAYDTYKKELDKRVKNLDDAFAKKREEVADKFRAQSQRYILALLEVDKLPIELFYEIMGPEDINPVIVRQWQELILRRAKTFDPIFAPWHALSALNQKEFPQKAPQIIHDLTTDPSKPLNANVAHAIATTQPTSMREIAAAYGNIFKEVDTTWRELKKSTPTATNLPDPSLDALRQILYGPESPALVPPGSFADIEFFFDEGGREQIFKLQGEIDRWIISAAGAPPHALILEDRPTQQNPRILKRGNPAIKGDEVPRQFLSILSGPNRQSFKIGSGRLELAEAIANKSNPLTARVLVNRIWQYHFGRGLVSTPSDFGTRCETPSHPELLDYLAVHFMNDGWSIKTLHRMLMLSATYQQSSDDDASRIALDPENRFLSRMNRTRLDFESMRDSLLSASGDLDLAMGGRPVEMFKAPFAKRRSVYGLVDRQFLPATFRTFDFANPDLHSPLRADTTVPQQALFMMNSPFVIERSRALANRPDLASIQDPAQKIQKLYQILYQRNPTSQQLQAALTFIDTAQKQPTPPSPPPSKPSDWQYGFGQFSDATGKIKSFTPLPHFTGDSWQGGPQWPDAALGWVRITADGGHAGNDYAHAAIRRWTAPRNCTISISGTVAHDVKEGNGIRAKIIHSGTGELAGYSLLNQSAETKFEPVEMKKGDTLDFLIDFKGDLNSDQFKWSPSIKCTDKPAKERATQPPNEPPVMEWNAKKDFSGPTPTPPVALDPWSEYAQVLLLSNEFMFVD